VYLRFRRAEPGAPPLKKLHDPPALSAAPGMCVSPDPGPLDYLLHLGDLVRSVLSAPKVLADILPSFIPYTLVVAAFAAFVLYNGGIVLGMLVSNEGCFN
jgi:alpha-1,2-glucosyltransferase